MQRILVVILLTLLVLGCAVLSPAPTPTPVPSPTLTPTRTAIPTLTPLPTHTQPAPSPTQDLLGKLVPAGTPAREWNGIPIMPGALRGEGDDKGYTFTIQATSEQIADFYDKELTKLGWEPFAQGETEVGPVILFYRKDDAVMTVAIMDHNGQEMIVMIVK